jgi:hypothetical protein
MKDIRLFSNCQMNNCEIYKIGSQTRQNHLSLRWLRLYNALEIITKMLLTY